MAIRCLRTAFLAMASVIGFFVCGCGTNTESTVDNRYPISQVNYNYSHIGNFNNASIIVKDYEVMGIIFVKSSEAIDGNGNHTGSKITNDMLMLEAQKLGAHDVINIRIDVNQKEEFTLNEKRIKTIYDYTATALAIKYTTALAVGNAGNSFSTIGNNDIVLNVMERSVRKEDNTTQKKDNNIQLENKEGNTGSVKESAERYTVVVVRITGVVKRQEMGGNYINVKVGDVLDMDTIVDVTYNSSLTVNNGNRIMTITSRRTGQIGKIDDLTTGL